MLFQEGQIGPYKTKNRIVMPPMTRSRAAKGEVPTETMAEYYAQRAGAGLIITEGTQVSKQGQGYAWTPGIYTPEQLEGWKKVTEKVHDAGGLIYAQLWHVGRVSHVLLQENNQPPVSSSDLVAEGVKVFVDPEEKGPEAGVGEMVQHSKPRPLSKEEIKDVINDFVTAAQNAMEAGFDGVELHGANGYLINQFLDSQANNRTDEYGGSLENRLRFLKEVTEAVVEVMGKEKVGVRLAPLTTLQGAVDDNPEETYISAAQILNEIGISYIHIAEADWDDAPFMEISFKEKFRKVFDGKMIYAGKYDHVKAEKALRQGWADFIGFGRPFVANPDLPFRLANDLPLNEGNPETYFGGTEKGLTDYPTWNMLNKESISQ